MTLQQPVEFHWNGELIVTTPGRVIFTLEVDRALADALHGVEVGGDFVNRTLSKRS